MKREYQGGEKQNVQFFVGKEIEKTACYGQKTLFVTGLNEYKLIKEIAVANNVEHIYLGANHSFDKPLWNYELASLRAIIHKLLMDDYNVTLDVDYHYYTFWLLVLKQFYEDDQFFLNVSIKLEDIEKFKNISFKLDDIDFNKSNRGVWVYKLNDKDFTPWSEYSDDKALDL